jgi:hypothetical protein
VREEGGIERGEGGIERGGGGECQMRRFEGEGGGGGDVGGLVDGNSFVWSVCACLFLG